MDFLKKYPELSKLNLLSSIGKDKDKNKGVDDKLLLEGRVLLANYLGVDLNDDNADTELISPLFEGWAKVAQDPDLVMAKWLRTCAPAGVERDIELAGIFPPSSQAPSNDFTLVTHEEDLQNYISMEDSSHGQKILDQLLNCGYIVECMSVEEAREVLGGEDQFSTRWR